MLLVEVVIDLDDDFALLSRASTKNRQIKPGYSTFKIELVI